jgi:tRNA threonylcarbamoyladenosine biosynthesis protein TsaE
MDVVYTVHQLPQIAALLCAEGKDYLVWALYAPMGAGKTTLVQALASHIGVLSGIGSPTYSIINEYEANNGQQVYHMDWYRLKNAAEAIEAGVEDALLSGQWCLVEWPEKAPELLPENTWHVAIEIIDAQTRRLYTLNQIPNVAAFAQ